MSLRNIKMAPYRLGSYWQPHFNQHLYSIKNPDFLKATVLWCVFSTNFLTSSTFYIKTYRFFILSLSPLSDHTTYEVPPYVTRGLLYPASYLAIQHGPRGNVAPGRNAPPATISHPGILRPASYLARCRTFANAPKLRSCFRYSFYFYWYYFF